MDEFLWKKTKKKESSGILFFLFFSQKNKFLSNRNYQPRCLYQSHCTIPTISTANLMVLAACNLLWTLRNTIPTSASKATACSMAIRDLCAIINPTLPPSAIAARVGAALELRVPPASIPRSPGTRVLHPTVSNATAQPLRLCIHRTSQLPSTLLFGPVFAQPGLSINE